ncbi:Tetratricopeptide repeat protein 28 [Hondaea fermentalgiana]|uniref:Tetratricopeptide repeat protein 28 n=1 Tax=Hondaea fermentalgiana TaxID=2315210 RepID=A0A2R5GCG8_9STRA|nr:Tetratricopeptide repeat protein 28 [Hondaea fermentalgiana]|eukprot:GBG28670.1 Tetratricopeptide repeat protein 28 [Hondaea fermentalgiana]
MEPALEEKDDTACGEAVVAATQTHVPQNVAAVSGGGNVSPKLHASSQESKLGDFGFGLGTPSLVALLEPDANLSKGALPQLDLPQRVGHPSHTNAPQRESMSSRDARILQVFGASAVEEQRGSPSGKGGRKSKMGASARKAVQQNNNTAVSRLRDLEMLAKSSRRAGKLAQEANAVYSRAVLFDNLERWTKAISSYEHYLDLCERLQDAEGAVVAYNCLGVAYFHSAVGGAEATSKAVGLNEANDEESGAVYQDEQKVAAEKNDDQSEPKQSERSRLLESSLAYHQSHLESADEAGQFVALCNIGLVYSRLGEFERAVDAHQRALRLAIDLRSPHGQSLAVGNLALCSAEMGDFDTAKACMDKHLSLVRDLRNPEAETLACQQLGQLANRAGHYDEAAEYFEMARRIATEAGDRGMLKLINCSIGVSHGNVRMQEYLKQLSHTFQGAQD